MSAVIVETELKGEEVEQIIVRRLVPAVADVERGKAMLALLTFFVVLSKPDLSAELLKSTVKGASEYIVMSLTEPEQQEAVMN